MDNGADLECFAGRLWDGVDKLGLDETSLAFGEFLGDLALASMAPHYLCLRSRWFCF